MILQYVLDPEKAQRFLEIMRKGFVRNPVFAAISFSIVVGLIISAIIIYKIVNTKKEKKELLTIKDSFKNKVNQKNLSAREKQILFYICDNLLNNKNHILTLLTNPVVFSIYSQIILNEKIVTAQELAALRMKLGINQRKVFNVLYSTADLTIGTSVKISFLKNYYFAGIISDIDEFGVSINIDKDISLEKNTPVLIEIDNQYGLFLIHSHVIGIHASIIKVEHSEKIEKFQKRKFFRKNIQLPVTIMKNEEDKGIHSYMLDLSGGGAKIYYPKNDFKTGDKIFVEISFNKKEDISLPCIIKRISKNDSSISVAFIEINESIRDKIVKAMLK